MSQKLLQLTITRVDGPVFDGKVQSLVVPGAAGEMTILANHEPLISPLKQGVIVVLDEKGEKHRYELFSGTIEISGNHATVLL